MQDHLAGVVGEIYVVENDFAGDAFEFNGAVRGFVFGRFVQNFAGAFEAGESFGHLRADADDLENRGDEHGQEESEGEEDAEGHGSGENLTRTQEHNCRADQAHQAGGGKSHKRSGGQCLQNVFEEALYARGKNFFLARFGVVALHHADPGETFGEAAGDFGIYFGARAENRANGLEGLIQAEAEDDEDGAGHSGHQHADLQQNDQRKDRSHNATNKFNQAGADQIADAFDVTHDPRNQDAGFIGVVIGDG
jgi:hypothetical protein